MIAKGANREFTMELTATKCGEVGGWEMIRLEINMRARGRVVRFDWKQLIES